MIQYRDLYNAYDIFRKSVWTQYIKNIKSVLGDTSERGAWLAKQSQSWRTNISLPLQQEMVDAMYAHIIDSKGKFIVEPLWGKQLTQAEPEVVEDTLNFIFEETWAWSVMLESIKDAVMHGNWYIKTIWATEAEEIEYMHWTKTKTAEMFNLDLPSIKYVDPFSIMIDPTATSIETARWVAERKFLHWGEIRKIYGKYFPGKTEAEIRAIYKKKVNTVENQWIIDREDLSLTKQQILLQINTDPSVVNIDLTPDDESLECIEVCNRNWKVQLFIDGVMMYNDKTLYPFSWFPYHSFIYDKQTNTFLGFGICDKTKPYQELVNVYINTHSDNRKLWGTPMFTQVVTPGQNMFETDTELDISPMKIVQVETPDGLKPLDLKVNDNMTEEINYLKWLAQTSVGINEMIMGVQGKVERSASAVNNLTQSFKARMRPLYNSIVAAIEQTGKQWLYLLVAYTNAKDVLNIKKTRDDWTYEIKDLTVEQLLGRWSVKFNIAGLNTSMREIEKKQLQEIMPIIMQMRDKNNMPLANQKQLLQKLIELYGFDQSLITPETELMQALQQQQQWQQWQQWGSIPTGTLPEVNTWQQSAPVLAWQPSNIPTGVNEWTLDIQSPDSEADILGEILWQSNKII